MPLRQKSKESENDMKRCLNWWDHIWFGLGSAVGAGIFVLTGQEANEHAGAAIVLSYTASGFSAMLSVLCYTEFSVEVPVASGSFSCLRIEFGDFAAFITAANILLESIVGSAVVARAWTSYFTTLLGRPPNSLRIKTDITEGYNLLDPIAVAVLAIAAIIAMISTKKASYLNWIASAVNIAAILFVIIAGFSQGKTSNLTPFLPYGAKGIFQAAAVVYFGYTGFDNLVTMAQETKNPSRDIPTVLLVGALGQGRYTTHIARAHMIPPWFALVHPKTGTPINATLMITISSALIAFFSGLDILSSLLSISTLFIFMMMTVALLVRRYYVRGKTEPRHLSKLVLFIVLIVASSIGTAAY